MSNLNSDNDQLVINTLTLLSKFLDRYEGKKTLKSENKATGAYNSYQNVSLPVILKPDGVKKNVQASYFQSIGHLRVKVAEAFGFQLNEYTMCLKNQIVDPDDDDER